MTEQTSIVPDKKTKLYNWLERWLMLRIFDRYGLSWW